MGVVIHLRVYSINGRYYNYDIIGGCGHTYLKECMGVKSGISCNVNTPLVNPVTRIPEDLWWAEHETRAPPCEKRYLEGTIREGGRGRRREGEGRGGERERGERREERERRDKLRVEGQKR